MLRHHAVPRSGRGVLVGPAHIDAALEHGLSNALKDRTRAHYQDLLDRYLLPTFGGMRLDAISPASVKSWYRKLGDDRPTMRAHAYGLLRTILGAAVADEAITRNPCQIRGAGRAKWASRTEPATLHEREIITNEMPPRLRMMVTLAAWTAGWSRIRAPGGRRSKLSPPAVHCSCCCCRHLHLLGERTHTRPEVSR